MSEEEIPGHLTRSLIGLEPTERTTRPFDQEQLQRAPATEPEPEQKTLDITNTQDSFATVPEITKEFEHLIDAVLDQRKPQVTINTMVNEEKKPEGRLKDKMPVNEPEQKGELKLNHLKPFTRKREEFFKM